MQPAGPLGGYVRGGESGQQSLQSLYIYGDSGLGKTHIVQSIGHEVRQRHPELQVLYVSMNKFQAQFQTAYKNGEIPDFIHFYQMIDVLIIDDIQELTGKTGTQNAFFNIFNHLQLAGKQLILTSDKPPVELKDIEQRLLTRFKWGLSAQLNTPDYDTKLKIIRAKAQKLGAQISDDVVAYLADNISANVREIEGHCRRWWPTPRSSDARSAIHMYYNLLPADAAACRGLHHGGSRAEFGHEPGSRHRTPAALPA